MAMPRQTVLYIGYPKAASTYIERVLESHPQVTIDRKALQPLLAPSISSLKRRKTALPEGTVVHVSVNEKVAESVISFGDRRAWTDNMFIPDGWDAVNDHVRVGSSEAAARMKKVYPGAKILIVTREQADWLDSAFRYFLVRLPPQSRSFADFCETPRGQVYLEAGQFDRTIEAYAKEFGPSNVAVLRYEDLANAPDRFASQLTAFLGIDPISLPSARSNVGSARPVALLRRSFPFVDKLPAGVKAIGRRALSSVSSQQRCILSDDEILMIRRRYETSNQRTKKLMQRLWSDECQ